MAKTATERQARYRASRNEGDGDYRLNTWISTSASLALARLARHEGVTKRALLERLVIEADRCVLNSLEPDAPEWNEYFATRPLRRNETLTAPTDGSDATPQ